MARPKVGQSSAAGAEGAWVDSVTNPNASGGQKGPYMFTHISPEDMLSLRAKGATEPRWSKPYYAIANPESFSESVAPQYSRRPVLGLSHEVVQYVRTASREISMELWCSYHVVRLRKPQLDRLGASSALFAFRNFLESLTVPAGPRLAPPLVDIFWPNAYLHFKGVVTDLSLEYTRFAYDGQPIEFTASIDFLEVGRGLMTQATVGKNGWGARVNQNVLGDLD